MGCMAQTGWLDQPQEWRGIPEEDRSRKRFGESPLKDKLDVIVRQGAAGRPFLLRREALSDRKRLTNMAADYRRRYGKAGFGFEVRKLPDEDGVGLWTVWQPPQERTAVRPGTTASLPPGSRGWNACGRLAEDVDPAAVVRPWRRRSPR